MAPLVIPLAPLQFIPYWNQQLVPFIIVFISSSRPIFEAKGTVTARNRASMYRENWRIRKVARWCRSGVLDDGRSGLVRMWKRSILLFIFWSLVIGIQRLSCWSYLAAACPFKPANIWVGSVCIRGRALRGIIRSAECCLYLLSVPNVTLDGGYRLWRSPSLSSEADYL